MLEGYSTNCPIVQLSMLFIVMHRIRQCMELPVMAVILPYDSNLYPVLFIYFTYFTEFSFSSLSFSGNDGRNF